MKYQKVIMFDLAIVVIGATLYYVIFNRSAPSNTSPENIPTRVEQTTLQAQSVTIETVIYTVTPKILTPNSETWDFEVKMDTHTGSLDQDLVAIVRMVDDKGNEYKAVKWEGLPPGGHHREGVLTFSPITESSTFIKLNIESSGDSERISLRWDI